MSPHGVETSGARPRGARLEAVISAEQADRLNFGTDDLPPSLRAANTCLRRGDREAASAWVCEDLGSEVTQWLARDPERTDLLYLAGRVAADAGCRAEAETWFSQALAVLPHAGLHAQLAALAFRDRKRISEAVSHRARACALEPDNLLARAAHAQALFHAGRVAEAIAGYEAILERSPDAARAALDRLWALHYLPGWGRAEFARAYRDFGRRFAGDLGRDVTFPRRPRDGRLRLGLLSRDFRENSPLSSYVPILQALDRERFELRGYGAVGDPDAETDRIGAGLAGYRDVYGLSDAEAAARIRADGIDVLIAFGGTCPGHRLGILAHRAAPVQADLGGIDTLGLDQVDYRITDAIQDPPASQTHFVERLVYLPGGMVTFRPPATSPPVGPLPAQRTGAVTFGSFNDPVKLNDMTLALWAEILRRLPAARLVLKFPVAGDPGVREWMAGRCESAGIAPARLTWYGSMSYPEHLARFGEVDLLLDAFPFNGSRTTLEGLWMGVPIVTLSGETLVSRMGRVILEVLGLQAFVAETPADYVARACAFAGQTESLAAIRAGLRTALLSSPICDPRRFARELGEACATMAARSLRGDEA